MRRLFYSYVHNCIVHPMLWCSEVSYEKALLVKTIVEKLHEVTGDLLND